MDEQRTANVQLTADVQQYSQGIQQANKDTNSLLASVQKLSKSLDGITGRIGKRLMLFSAADVAAMTAAVAVTAKYESQLRTLRAEATAADRVMANYTTGIKNATKAIPVARGEITQLTTQIAQLGVTTTTEIPKMAVVFERMSAATGESVGELTSGLIELSRVMGTLPNGAKGLENFSDSVVKLSAELGVSSTSVLNFAQSIAPIADVAGISQKAVLGLSAAFVRAGADGVAGANAFNTIMRDIVQLTTTGSPELIKYANAAHMSLDAFKNLDPAMQFVKIMNSVSNAGSKGIQMLDAIGVDGIRTVKAVAAVTREYGSLEKAIGMSEGAYGQGWTKKASQAAWDDMQAAMVRTQQTMQDMADSFATYVYPAAKSLLNVFNSMLSTVSQLAEPFLKLAGVISGVAAAFTGVVGGMLTAIGPLSTLMLAMTAFRLSPMRAGGSGFSEGITRARAGIGPAPMPFTEAGRRAAAGALPIHQRIAYNIGERVGNVVGRYTPEGAATAFRAAGYGAFRGIQTLADSQSQWIANAAMRQGLDRVSMFSGAGATGGTQVPGAGRAMAGGMWQMFRSDPRAFMQGMFTGQPVNMQGQSLGQMTTNMAATTRAYAEHAAAVMAARGSTASLAAAAGGAARSLGLIPLAYARMGASLGLQAAGGIAAAPFRMLGGIFGGGGLLGASLAAIGGSAYMMKQAKDSYSGTWSNQSNITEYNTALGLATEPLSEFAAATKNAVASLSTLSDAMALAAKNSGVGSEYTDKRAGAMPSNPQALVAYMQSMGAMNPQQAYYVASDVSKNLYGTGINPQMVFDLYNQQTNYGANPFGAAGQASNDLLRQVQATQRKNQGWTQDLFSIQTDEARNLIEQAYATTVMESQQYQGRNVTGSNLFTAGATAQEIANIAKANGSLNNVALDRVAQATGTRRNIETAVTSLTMGQLNTLLDSIAKQVGGETGTFGIGVQEMRGLQEGGYNAIMARIAASDTAASKAFIEMMSYNVSDATFASLLAQKPAGAVARTALGQRSQESQTFQSATATGEGSASNKAIFNAIRETADYLLTTSKTASDIAMIARTEMANYAPSSREYGLYQAAEQLATRRSLFRTEQQQGRQAATAQRYEALSTTIRADTSGDVSAQRDEMFQIRQSTRQDAAEYLLFVKNFYRQLQYATEDHARSIKRASEDAARSMFSPYERMAAQATISVESMLANTQEQMQYINAGKQAVDRLKKMGLSQQAVDVYNLADPQMAQQALRTALDVQSNPSLLNQMNKNAKAMGSTATNVTQDVNNVSYRRGEEDFKRAQDRNMAALRRYGEQVLGDTKDVLAETQGYLKDMGVTTTDYLQSLTDLANRILSTGSNPKQGSMSVRERARRAKPGETVDYGAQTGETAGWTATKGEDGKWSLSDPDKNTSIMLPKNWMNWSDKEKVAYVTTGTAGRAYEATMNAVNANQPTPDNPNATTVPPGKQYDPQNPNDFFQISRLGGPYVTFMSKGKLYTYSTKNLKIGPLPEGFDAWPSYDKDQWWQTNVVETKKGAFLGGITSGNASLNVGEYNRDELIHPLFGTAYNAHVSRMAGAITTEMVKGVRTAGYGSRPSQPSYGGGEVTYNNGTYITGPITVQAQNPDEMDRQLRNKARLANLSKGANASYG